MSEQLIVAIFKQDVAEVKRILDLPNIDLNYRYRPKSKNMDIVVTPLQFAASTGNVAIIKLLLEKGADPLAVSGYKRSALSIAAYYGHLDACKELILVSDILATDIAGVTVYGNAQKGADKTTLADKTDKKKRCLAVRDFLRTPTYIEALRVNNANILKEVEKDSVDYVGAFVAACRLGDLEIVRKMLQLKCVDINGYYDGETGLHAACLEGHSSIVFELLRHKGLNVNARTTRSSLDDKTGCTALYLVCTLNEGTALSDPNSKIGDEQSIRVDIAEMLLNHDADVNLKDSSEYAPIHMAIMYNMLDLVKLFVLRGANLDMRVKYPEDLVKKHMPNPAASDFYANLLSFSINRPEIRGYLEEAIQGKCISNRQMYISGALRFNYNHPTVKITPIRFDGKDDMFDFSKIPPVGLQSH